MKPYLTVDEYKRVPSAINVSNLDYFSGISDATAQDSELANVIERASAWVDSYCTAPDGFWASEVTETRSTFITRDGYLRVRPNNFPINELKSIKYRNYPTQPWNIVDTANVEQFERYFETPLLISPFGTPMFGYPIGSYPVSGQTYVPYVSPTDAANLQDVKVTIQYTYVKGYAHTLLASDAFAGTSEITVVDPTGIKVGTELTIYDGGHQERIKAATTPVGNVVTLTQPLTSDHASGVGVSAIPADIKQACILMVNYFLKERGVNSITIEGTANPMMQKYDDIRDVKLAKEILSGYRRVIV
ncbi:hypothetical protein [Paenibacillus hexagrammi]|uniref:Uncharacterized protein n=1 Tax=Paenibacillus hexagrammi TaxID=2908839 RepID=A0ABY3SSL3_9BACL|nr:hypothetical protein [Paenibacillus sp. YPD9-1]UJF36634.1 hypothetical protein L0M14_30560 [Paenibacillus sp. YPD9-1]